MARVRLSLFLILALTFAILPVSTAAAEDGQAYKVGATSLNVRSEPSLEATVVGSLEDGTVVTVYGERYGWAKIYYDGTVAWVASQFLYPLSSSTGQSFVGTGTGKQVTVSVDSVHIRGGPSIHHPITSFAFRGRTFQLLGKKDRWAHIRLDNGETGWIAGWLLTTSSEQPTTHITSLKGYNIVIDAGHGGFDPGAIGINGTYEKHFTLEISKQIAEQLRQAGAHVIMTRTGNYFLTLEERVNISQQHQTDAFISIHLNSFHFMGVQGIRTYYYAGGEDQALAQAIQKSLAQKTRLQNGGVRFGNFHVLRENPDLAVLVELGFLTSPYDFSLIQTSQYQSNVAEAITQGLINHFNNY